MKKKLKKKRLRGMDGLKTLALIGVLLYHAFPSFLPGGFLGVVLFLVISGYLSAYGSIDAMEEGTFSYVNYYKKRILRLYPSLLVVLLVSIGLITFLDPIRLANTQSEFLSIVGGYNNFWQIGANADYFAQLSRNSPFTHLWYIALLLQFDLVFPFILKGYAVLKKKAGKGKALLISFGVVVLSALVMPVSYLVFGDEQLTAVYYSTFTRIMPLLAGVWLALVHHEKIRILHKHLKRPVFGLLEAAVWIGVIVIMYFKADGKAAWIYLYGMNIVTLLTMRLIEVCRTSSFTGKLLDNPVCAWIGKYNYEIFLWQYPVMSICGILSLSGTWYFSVLQIVLIVILSWWLSEFSGRLRTLLS